MRIGILGAGNIGGTLGRKWAEAGHDVFFGVRSPQSEEVQAVLRDCAGRAQAGSVADAIQFGEAVVLAVPGGAARETVEQGRDWKGKVLVDAANRFSPSAPSLTEELAQWVPEARVVKAFNTAGFEALADPTFGGGSADTFICGDDRQAKQTVSGLAREIGLGVVDAGPLSSAPLLDSLTKLWIQLTQPMGRGIVFKLLVR